MNMQLILMHDPKKTARIASRTTLTASEIESGALLMRARRFSFVYWRLRQRK